MREIRYCYEAAQVRSPGLEGKLGVHFGIGASGSVTRASVASSTLGDEALSDCVLRKLSAWKFPRPKTGVEVAVNYPFIFKTIGR
jgi:TonB family protein